jgi:hypothetical protein
VDWREAIYGLDLDDHPILDNQVRAEPDVDPNRSVDHWNCLLAHRPESTLSEFIGKHSMVTDSSNPGPSVVWMRKAASTISLAMAFSVMAAFYSLSPRRQGAKNAAPERA